MSSRGFSALLLLVIIALLVAIGAGVFYLYNQQGAAKSGSRAGLDQAAGKQQVLEEKIDPVSLNGEAEGIDLGDIDSDLGEIDRDLNSL